MSGRSLLFAYLRPFAFELISIFVTIHCSHIILNFNDATGMREQKGKKNLHYLFILVKRKKRRDDIVSGTHDNSHSNGRRYTERDNERRVPLVPDAQFSRKFHSFFLFSLRFRVHCAAEYKLRKISFRARDII